MWYRAAFYDPPFGGCAEQGEDYKSFQLTIQLLAQLRADFFFNNNLVLIPALAGLSLLRLSFCQTS